MLDLPAMYSNMCQHMQQGSAERFGYGRIIQYISVGIIQAVGCGRTPRSPSSPHQNAADSPRSFQPRAGGVQGARASDRSRSLRVA